jgi:phosphoglycolate phosphatase-like HAD superfamily hydrolase
VTHVLLWDIDGTLLSTARAGVFALEEAARDVCGRDVDLNAMHTAGLTDGEIAAAILRASGEEVTGSTVARFLRSYERHLPERLGWRRGRVLPGVEPILEHLRDRPDVISLLLTGNTPAGARAKLAHYGLERHFDGGVFCTDWEDRISIARRAVALAAERAGAELPPEALVVIGDTPHDVRCGLEIGARTVAVASGAYTRDQLEEAGAWLVVDELPTPEAFVRRIGVG